MHPSDQVAVVLHSTYWLLDDSPHQDILRSAGPPTTAPNPSGCAPGGGCGTVTGHYQADHTGVADITAHRTVCGEALACSPAQTTFSITIRVTR